MEQNNLPAALARLIAQARTGTQSRIAFCLRGTPRPLPAEMEMNLLRISQEALHNACKHAQARVIEIELTFTAHQVRLRVYDDGCGFDVHAIVPSRSFGMISMRERAERLGGRFTLTSRPGKGTTVVAIVPNSHPF